MQHLKWTGLAVGALAFAASPASAHHSHAMFDHAKEMSLAGTVTGFEFTFFKPCHAKILFSPVMATISEPILTHTKSRN
mgnify:CR=1 FL=1